MQKQNNNFPVVKKFQKAELFSSILLRGDFNLSFLWQSTRFCKDVC